VLSGNSPGAGDVEHDLKAGHPGRWSAAGGAERHYRGHDERIKEPQLALRTRAEYGRPLEISGVAGWIRTGRPSRKSSTTETVSSPRVEGATSTSA
jgi:hypothetical protein